MIKLLLCKIYDEINDKNAFKININEEDTTIGSRIRNLFEEVKKDEAHTNIFCADSLYPESWTEQMRTKIKDNSFDIVLTNPPFGAKIYVDDERILKNFKLARRWKKDKHGKWQMLPEINKQVPQVLFIERCLQLLKPGGKMAIVLPDGIFGNPSYAYIWEYIREEAIILAIISLPPETFLPSTHTKTSVLLLQKKLNSDTTEDYPIFMAIAHKVGHNKNGKIIFKMDNTGKYLLDDNNNKIIDEDLTFLTTMTLK